MAKFKDRFEREWKLDINIGMMDSLKEHGLDLDDFNEQGIANVVFASPRRFGAVLYIICEEQATAKNVTPEGFASGFNLAALEAAREALLEAIVDFIQPRQVAGATKKRLPNLMKDFNQAVEAKAEEIIEKYIGDLRKSPGDSPA